MTDAKPRVTLNYVLTYSLVKNNHVVKIKLDCV